MPVTFAVLTPAINVAVWVPAVPVRIEPDSRQWNGLCWAV
jgi:hypothetical protein